MITRSKYYDGVHRWMLETADQLCREDGDRSGQVLSDMQTIAPFVQIEALLALVDAGYQIAEQLERLADAK